MNINTNNTEFSEKQAKFANDMQLLHLKARLAASDYKALKYAEGIISDADYAVIRRQRQALRDQINGMEAAGQKQHDHI